MVDTTGSLSKTNSKAGLTSPQGLRTINNKRFSNTGVSPLRMNDPGRTQGFTIIENGERRVVGKAAKHHWNFARDNPAQLRQHINDLRF